MALTQARISREACGLAETRNQLAAHRAPLFWFRSERNNERHERHPTLRRTFFSKLGSVPSRHSPSALVNNIVSPLSSTIAQNVYSSVQESDRPSAAIQQLKDSQTFKWGVQRSISGVFNCSLLRGRSSYNSPRASTEARGLGYRITGDWEAAFRALSPTLTQYAPFLSS